MTMLRRTFTPYVGLVYINVATTLGVVYVAYRVNDWHQLKVALLLYMICGVYVWFATRYRVSWGQDGITMYADWGRRTIEYCEISSVRYETASIVDGRYATRPFRRIVVRGSRQNPKAFVDVSLRHFEPVDIGALLTEISVQRPDLDIPWQTVRQFIPIPVPDESDAQPSRRQKNRGDKK